jgi:hypothetical protein
MKKFLALAAMATLLTAGSAFAVERHFGAAPNATFANGFGPTTTNNDDSCDIGVAPAATLLLPVFEVDVASPRVTGENTLFTVTNVSRFPQIGHVTVWSEYSYPVLDFNIFLTGYDVVPMNMYDIIASGIISGGGTSSNNTGGVSPVGVLSGSSSTVNSTNTYLTTTLCASLPGQLPSAVQSSVITALTTGAYAAGGATCTAAGTVGGNHPGVARGYVTVDVAAACSTYLPTDSTYYGAADGILFDNVLIGDYEQLGNAPAGTTSATFNGAGAPMVHIRAIPEGGPAGNTAATNLPFTFYDRYTAGASGSATLATTRVRDRRQPLPSTFAARYIENSASGFSTNYRIWREGTATGGGATPVCTGLNTAGGNQIPIAEIVRFDETENPFTLGSGTICSPTSLCGVSGPTLPEASITATTASVYPQFSSSASTKFGGWMYLNLNNGGAAGYSTQRGGFTTTQTGGGPAIATTVRPSQNWVTVEMFSTATPRLSADFDAAWLGNGCSAPAAAAGTTAGTATIGPAGGVFVCPVGVVCANTTVGTNATP